MDTAHHGLARMGQKNNVNIVELLVEWNLIFPKLKNVMSLPVNGPFDNVIDIKTPSWETWRDIPPMNAYSGLTPLEPVLLSSFFIATLGDVDGKSARHIFPTDYAQQLALQLSDN
ncbi:hypothetical protein EMPG_12381 [Blastomyces silverae]|uniref:Uncharacterized protein n=1 Tax=Blastomyces silverae TaxID=2060906 RepID=A0A0H1BML5_9EURO|nr:hypothetical protein EMPG_12381 [Blastomyces silverae]